MVYCITSLLISRPLTKGQTLEIQEVRYSLGKDKYKWLFKHRYIQWREQKVEKVYIIFVEGKDFLYS